MQILQTCYQTLVRNVQHHNNIAKLAILVQTSVESKTRLTLEGNFVPDSTTSSKIACLCTVMSYQDLGFSYKILLPLEFLDKILESLTSSKKS